MTARRKASSARRTRSTSSRRRRSLLVESLESRQLMALFDLTTIAVTGPANATQDQSVTVNWQVRNIGTGTASGVWSDAVYLSSDKVWSPDDALLGTFERPASGGIGPNQTYSNSGQVTLPGVLPGDYHFIVRADTANAVNEDGSESNNAGASAATVATTLPSLALGTPTSVTLSGDGDSSYYQLALPAGADLSLSTIGLAGNSVELYVKFGELPTRQSFDARGAVSGTANQSLALGSTLAGTYYVLVYGDDIPSPTQVGLAAAQANFGITGILPSTGSNTGRATITIRGAQFNANSTVRLIDSGGNPLAAEQVYFTNSGLIHATFNLTGRPTGLADIEVVNPGNVTTSLPDAFNIVAGTTGRLVTKVIAPANIQVGQAFEVRVEYENAGQTDLIAPLMQLLASGPTQVSFYSNFTGAASILTLVGAGAAAPAGILPPGARGSFTLYGRATGSGTVAYQLQTGDYPSTPIDWAALESSLRPSGISNATWTPLFAKLQQNLGSTWQSLTAAVAQSATLLPTGLGLNYRPADVFQVDVLRARSQIAPSIVGKLYLNDTAHPLANARLTLRNVANGSILVATSLNDGTFFIPGSVAGSYEMRIEGYAVSTAQPLVVGAGGLANASIVAQQAASIAGIVIGSEGAPLRDVAVTAADANGVVYAVSTDHEGHYRLDTLPAGRYQLSARVSGQVGVVQSVEVVAGEVVNNINFVLQLGGAIFVNVHQTGGTTLANALVSALGADGRTYAGRTDANGLVTILGVPPQVYRVVAQSGNLIAASQSNVVISAPGTVAGVDLSLNAGGAIHGTVTNAAGGTPVANAVLTIQNGTQSFLAQTDATGAFTATGIPAGTYTVSIASSTLMPASTPAVVVVGQTTNVGLSVAPAGTVSGVVTSTTGGGAIGGVVVHALASGQVVASAVTAANGSYTLSGLTAGTFQIVLGDNLTPGAAASSAVLSTATPTATVNFNIATAGRLSGVVFAANGTTPIANALVALIKGNSVVLTTLTDANGVYSIVALAADTYQLEAIAEDLSFAARTGINVSGGASITGQNFVAGTRTVSGIVRNASSLQPIAGAKVQILRAGAGDHLLNVASITTAADGSYSFTAAIDGDYRVVASDGTLALAATAVTVAGANLSNVDFSLAAAAVLNGTIRSAAGNALLVGAVVSITNIADPQINASIVTGNDGTYQFAGLPAGNYRLSVVSPAHESAVQANIALAAGAQTSDFTLNVGTITVSGTVTQAGRALYQVLVTARDANGIIRAQTKTNTDGTYSLTTLPAGNYNVVATGVGVVPSAATPIVVSGGQNLTGVNFTLTIAAIADPGVDSPPVFNLPPAADWVKQLAVLPIRRGDQLTRQTVASDLANLPQALRDVSQLLLAAIDGAEQRFRDWEDVGSNLEQYSALGRLMRDWYQQIADLGKQAAKLNAVLAGLPEDLYQAAMERSLEFSAVETLFNDLLGSMRQAVADLVAGDITAARDAVDDVAGLVVTAQATVAEIRTGLLASLRLTAKPSDVYLVTEALAALTALDTTLTSIATSTPQLQIELTALDQYRQNELIYNGTVNLALRRRQELLRYKDNARYATFEVKPPLYRSGPLVSATASALLTSNTKIGSAGSGAQRFVQEGSLAYQIAFRNDPGAGATAVQEMTVTDTLDADLDAASLQFVSFGFNNFKFNVPVGLTHYETTIDLRPDGISLLVDVTLDLDLATRQVRATFRSIDPTTGLPPTDPNSGFLPVNQPTIKNGEGFLRYTVRALSGKPTGTQISNQASIVLDGAPAIVTPAALNTLDTVAPASQVAALPPQTTSAAFTVSWSGTDDAGGSGVGIFTIFVSDNGGAFHVWLDGTSTTSGIFSGQGGHSYRFYSVVRDNAGNLELPPAGFDAETAVSDVAVRIDVTLTTQPTTTSALGEVDTLPTNVTWIDEWQSTWVEVWVNASESSAGIDAASTKVSFNSSYFVAQTPTKGAAFATFTSNVDNVGGVITLSGSASSAPVGQGSFVLLARIRLTPKPNGGVPIQLNQAAPIAPAADEWLALVNDGTATVTFEGGGAAEVAIGDRPETNLFPLLYDLNDSGRVDFGDFSIFASTFLMPVGGTPASFKADFNHDDQVDFGDFSLFATNFFATAGSTITYPANFPADWQPVGGLTLPGEPTPLAATFAAPFSFAANDDSTLEDNSEGVEPGDETASFSSGVAGDTSSTSNSSESFAPLALSSSPLAGPFPETADTAATDTAASDESAGAGTVLASTLTDLALASESDETGAEELDLALLATIGGNDSEDDAELVIDAIFAGVMD